MIYFLILFDVLFDLYFIKYLFQKKNKFYTNPFSCKNAQVSGSLPKKSRNNSEAFFVLPAHKISV